MTSSRVHTVGPYVDLLIHGHREPGTLYSEIPYNFTKPLWQRAALPHSGRHPMDNYEFGNRLTEFQGPQFVYGILANQPGVSFLERATIISRQW